MLKSSFTTLLASLLLVCINGHPIVDTDYNDKTLGIVPHTENAEIRLRRSGPFASNLNPAMYPGAMNPALNAALNGGILPGGGFVPGGGIHPVGGLVPGGGIHPGTQYGTNIGVPLNGYGVHTAVGITSGGGGGGGGGGNSGGGGGGK